MIHVRTIPMIRSLFALLLLSSLFTQPSHGQVDNSFGSLPPFTKWYQNPLGVSPLALHTGSGLYIPALIAGTILVFTPQDSTLQDRLHFSADLGYTKGYYGSFSGVYHNTFGVHVMLRRYLSVGVEYTQVYINDNVNNVVGAGIRPMVRFYPVNEEDIKVYVSSGAGLIYFFDTFPKPSGFFGDQREGTRLNGCPKYGLGAELKVAERFMLSAGLWHIHFSNGNNPDVERNPGHDSNGLSFGLTYTP